MKQKLQNTLLKYRLNYIYRIIKLIIPFCIYSICLLRNPRPIKFVIPWAISNLKSSGSPLKDEEPWITFQAKEWLDGFLNQNMIVFEYGSGGSTLFFSKRVKKLISAEHDRVWYQLVSGILKEKNISNCEYLLLEPQPAPDKQSDFTAPRFGSSCPEYVNMSFEAYVKSINAYHDNVFDFVLVDGRARPPCILHALGKIRSGGFLMLDNSERTHYRLGIELLADWERIDFFGPGPSGLYFWQTSIFRKPCARKSNL